MLSYVEMINGVDCFLRPLTRQGGHPHYYIRLRTGCFAGINYKLTSST